MNTATPFIALKIIRATFKNFWFFILLMSNIAVAQLPITDPTPLQVCDDNYDGFTTFNLTTKNAEILNGLSATDYTISYHLTVVDAQTGANPLLNPNSYANNTPYNEMVYVRVQENANTSNFDTTTLSLVVLNQPPVPLVSTTPATCTTSGTATITNYNAANTYTFTPAGPSVGAGGVISGLFATTACFYTVIASSGGCTSLSSSCFGVLPANCTHAINDINNTYTNTPVSGNVLTNDYDLEGNTQVCTPYSGPISAGTLILNSDGNYTFTPNTGFTGTTFYTYDVCDTGTPVACKTADLTIEILPIPTSVANDGVTANNDTATTEENTPIPIQVLANDFDVDGDTFTITSNTQPTYGSVSMYSTGANQIMFNYQSYGGFTGTDTFTYTICDNATPQACDTATVTIMVNPSNTTNETIANDDAGNGNQDLPITGNVLINDTDPEGNVFTITTNTQPVHGTSTIDPLTGIYVYTPSPGYTGPDSFTYTICDNGTPQACKTATVYLTVNPNNSIILSKDGYLNMGADGVANVGDVISYTFTVTNSSNNTLTGVTISDPLLISPITVTPSTLAAGQLATATAAYIITQANIDTGFVYNLATATGTVGSEVITCTSTDPTPCATCPILQTCPSCTIVRLSNPVITLTNDATYIDIDNNGIINVGDGIQFDFVATNIGSETLNAVYINNTLNPIQPGQLPSILSSGQQHLFSFTHVLTQANLNDGAVYNLGTVNASGTSIGSVSETSVDPTNPILPTNPYYDPYRANHTVMVLNNIISETYTNTITGAIKYDYNNNGCDGTDVNASNILVQIDNGISQWFTYANYLGQYTFFVPAGTFTITPIIQNNPANFAITPANDTVIFVANNNQTTTRDFCISTVNVIEDVDVAIYPTNAARPGFTAGYQVIYRNIGNTVVSNTITLNFNDDKIDFISASLPTVATTGSLEWSYTNLLPGEVRYIYVNFNVHTPTGTAPVNIGEILPFTIVINPIADANSLNNTMQYNQIVVGSYDPNIITCLEGANLPTAEIGDYLHYVVDFENTGNYPADFVLVRIPLDINEYDVSTLQILGTSHLYYSKLKNNFLDVFYQNIMLDTGGHGNVLLKIKSKNTLQAGDTVSKRADIYFDYNAPIDTGFANTTYQNLSATVVSIDNSVLVYPNPTNAIVNIKANTIIKTIELYERSG